MNVCFVGIRSIPRQVNHEWLKQLFFAGTCTQDLSEEIPRNILTKKSRNWPPVACQERRGGHRSPRIWKLTLIEEDSREIWRWPSIENFLVDLR